MQVERTSDLVRDSGQRKLTYSSQNHCTSTLRSGRRKTIVSQTMCAPAERLSQSEIVCIDESILPEDTTFGVRISGDSMEPEFHDGQIAWVLQQESVANGEIGIFALNGEAYIKKLQNDKDGIFLISLNEKYAPIKVGENDRLDIFGKVLGKSDASAITGHCR